MDEYIKRKDLSESIKKNVKPPSYSTRSQRELVEWCKDECIRQAHCLPFVCDVVPKSEVDRLNAVMKEMDEQRAYTINMLGESLEKAKSEVEMLQGALKAEERHNELTMEMAQKALKNAKAEVAREIFEEIEKVITKECLVFKDENGIRGYVDASVHYAIAELKKKYEVQYDG